MKLLLDEHFSPEIARQLRARGHDVLAAREEPHLRGQSDRELLARATEESCAMVTENVADFAPLHHEYVTRGVPHAGIVFTSPKQFPRTRDGIGGMVRALDALMRGHPAPDALRTDTRWLVSADDRP